MSVFGEYSRYYDLLYQEKDYQGEAEFIEECRDALKQRTVVMITHRPASLALADRILRLEAGEIRADMQDARCPGLPETL